MMEAIALSACKMSPNVDLPSHLDTSLILTLEFHPAPQMPPHEPYIRLTAASASSGEVMAVSLQLQ
jgi:hypothetical protein